MSFIQRSTAALSATHAAKADQPAPASILWRRRFVYALQPNVASTEPHVWSCATLLFERYFSSRAVAVTTDCRHGELPAVRPEAHDAVARSRIAFDI
jgi:hypothetical protein